MNLTTAVGSVSLAAPVLTASGCAGHSTELANYVDFAELGAVVVKSMKAEPWPGNPAPRLRPTPAGLVNSVGLQAPSVAQWLANDLPELQATGASVVASIWGHTVDEFYEAASALAAAPQCVVAVEVNVSCPNLDERNKMFAHNAEATAQAVAASATCGHPIWAKLSPNAADITEIAAAAYDAGAEAVVLTNTLLAMVIDPQTCRPALGAKRGGLSGAALLPVAVRACYDVRESIPYLPIVGVGGISCGRDVVQFLAAGASAVEVGTATFADPRAPKRILTEFTSWCESHNVSKVSEIVGRAHH